MAEPGSSGWNADRAQGQHRHGGAADAPAPRGYWRGTVSPFNATVVERLRAPGRWSRSRANMDEFAMGSSTEHSAFGRVKHPLDPTRVPGRIVRRFGGAGSGRSSSRGARIGDRRLGAPAGQLLRRGRDQAELREGEPVRPGGIRLVARLYLGFRPHGRGRRPGTERDQRA